MEQQLLRQTYPAAAMSCKAILLLYFYLHSTTIVVLICILLTVPLCNWVMAEVMKIVFFEYSGWIVYYVPAVTYAKIIAAGVICYAVVTFLLNRKVKKIPMSDALKNVE